MIDFFSAKETITFRISKKSEEHISGTHGGYTGYFIYDGKEAFEVGKRTFDKLNVGNNVKLLYTKVQRNVRMIALAE